MNVENIIKVDCFEFDKLVEKTYGRSYCFQQQDGCKDRGVHEIEVPCEHPEDHKPDIVSENMELDEMGVNFKAWLERDPNLELTDEARYTTLNLYWERSFYPHIDMIVNDLHSKGLLSDGTYIINIDW